MNTTTFAGVRANALRSAAAALASLCALNSAGAQEAPAVPAATTEASAPAGPARVRLFGQNGVMVAFYQNSICIGGKGPKTTVSGGVGDAFSSFLGRAKNTSIGMTETTTTSNLSRRDGMLSKAYFREYEIPANQPMTLAMAFQSAAGARGSMMCSQHGGTFTPEAGKEYEVTLDIHPGQCLAVVREIQKSEQGPASLRDVVIKPTQECS